jgi:hypothetical protein
LYCIIWLNKIVTVLDTSLAGYGKMKTGHVGPHILRELIFWLFSPVVTNVDWKNTATVLNCVRAGWQDEEERLLISIFWASLCFAGDSESYNPLWNLERSTGHVPHTIAKFPDNKSLINHYNILHVMHHIYTFLSNTVN